MLVTGGEDGSELTWTLIPLVNAKKSGPVSGREKQSEISGHNHFAYWMTVFKLV